MRQPDSPASLVHRPPETPSMAPPKRALKDSSHGEGRGATLLWLGPPESGVAHDLTASTGTQSITSLLRLPSIGLDKPSSRPSFSGKALPPPGSSHPSSFRARGHSLSPRSEQDTGNRVLCAGAPPSLPPSRALCIGPPEGRNQYFRSHKQQHPQQQHGSTGPPPGAREAARTGTGARSVVLAHRERPPRRTRESRALLLLLRGRQRASQGWPAAAAGWRRLVLACWWRW
jgi:hypothetical protein